jgi:Myo-inositol oxygenase
MRLPTRDEPSRDVSPDPAAASPLPERGMPRRRLLTALAGTAAGGAAGLALGYRFAPELRAAKLRVLDAPLALPDGMADFRREAGRIIARHDEQTTQSIAALKARYEAAVFGRVRVWDLVEKLALCVDPTDMRLFCGSQLVHVQQILAAMERNAVTDPEMLLLAVIHDLGKVLLLAHEAPENVFCTTRHLGAPAPGGGLDEVLFQFGHPEFIYSRIRGHVPDHIAWTARYHNVHLDEVAPFMSQRDRDWTARYLEPFRKFDAGFGSPYFLPRVDLDRYRELIESAFPSPILV